MLGGDYRVVKISGGWTVEDSLEIFAVHPTQAAAIHHLDRLIVSRSPPSVAAPPSGPTAIPRSDVFVRRFS